MTSATSTGKRKAFPGLLETADKVYTKEKDYRDNSRFVETFIENGNALLFTRPPQLGKTTLLSLADMLLSKAEKAPRGIAYTPPEGVRNAWYVLWIDFGGIDCYSGGSDVARVGWESTAAYMDEKVNAHIQFCIRSFLDRHVDIKTILLNEISPLKVNDFPAGELLGELAQSITAATTVGGVGPKPTLLVLVDEYDKPIHDVLFGLLDTNPDTPALRATLQQNFDHYVNFFDNCKSLRSLKVDIKTWVTGISPVGLSLIIGFQYEDLTFDESMANAVGLLDADVDRMLDVVHQQAPFQNLQEKAAVRSAIQDHYKHLGFPFGRPQYHTGIVNRVMTKLQNNPRK
jgi:hypothetical protein